MSERYRVVARYVGHKRSWHSCSPSDWRNGCTGPHPNLKRAVECFNLRLQEAKTERDAGHLAESVEVVLMRGPEQVARRVVGARLVIREMPEATHESLRGRRAA